MKILAKYHVLSAAFLIAVAPLGVSLLRRAYADLRSVEWIERATTVERAISKKVDALQAEREVSGPAFTGPGQAAETVTNRRRATDARSQVAAREVHSLAKAADAASTPLATELPDHLGTQDRALQSLREDLDRGVLAPGAAVERYTALIGEALRDSGRLRRAVETRRMRFAGSSSGPGLAREYLEQAKERADAERALVARILVRGLALTPAALGRWKT